MKILALDDEALALEGLVDSIRAAAPDAVIGQFDKVSEALEWAREERPDVVFLDINLRADSGIDVAVVLMASDPAVNIIFTTGHKQYMEQALGMHVSGYVVKPVTSEKIRNELAHLRRPVSDGASGQRISVKTFGDFEIFADGTPIQFNYSKTKEIIAYLVDCRGSMCTNGKLIDVLWDDDNPSAHRSYFGNLLSDLQNTLKKYDCEEIIIRRRGQIGIDTTKISCDYYDWLAGDPKARAEFAGEYMFQYSWAETTLGAMTFANY
ncbi:MAG: response regulator [Clostridia bacterium]|nr:response regulator [Clostridia bacterium]